MKNLKQLICDKTGICSFKDVIKEIKEIPKTVWLITKLLFSYVNLFLVFIFGVIRVVWAFVFGVSSAIVKALIIDSVISSRKK